MPIFLPEGLPAARTLRAEGIEVASIRGADRGAAPALRIGLLNLMPDKPTAETQIARLLGAGPRRVELTLLLPGSHAPGTTTSAGHLRAFYRPWPESSGRRFDGLVVTGAPVEALDFDAVTYWRELRRILDQAQAQGTATLAICWAAMAALRHFHGIPKHVLAEKRSGVFRQRALRPDAPLLRGIGAEFAAPVSRRAEVRAADLAPRGVEVLAASEESGPCVAEDRALGLTAVFDHLEYDAGTLRAEFLRDIAAGHAAGPPSGYFPDGDPGRAPVATWRPCGLRLFGNWLADVEHRTCRERPRALLAA
jgi:homoserine O-succinyltransferase/O-acetyltransferase